MPQVISGGPDVFRAIAFQEHHPATLEYLRQQVQYAGSVLTDLGRAAYTKAVELYDQFNSSEALERARSLVRSTKLMFQPNTIRYLSTTEQFQNATEIMQRYLMTDPLVRELAQDQRIEGYAETYTDAYADWSTDWHPDQMRVMDGIIQETEATVDEAGEVIEPAGWFFETTLFDERVSEDERALDTEEQALILWSRDALRARLAEMLRDPTSPGNAKMS